MPHLACLLTRHRWLHPPAHIPIPTGEFAWVKNQNPVPYCEIIYCRDPKRATTETRQDRISVFFALGCA
jgi:hypothetical protein